jgi:signal transduction histidine kinase/sensor domain CHASE-containing protein
MGQVQPLRDLQAIMNRSFTPPEHVRENSGNAPAMNTHPWMAYVPIALVALIGVLVTWYSFNRVTDWEHQRVQQAFRAAASDRVLMVQREIEQSLGVVEDIGSFFDASEWVGRRDFRKFVGPALKRYASIAALQWIPRIAGAERDSFEKEARGSFTKFRMIESNQAGDLVRAVQRPAHFPVLYVQPYQLNKETLGLDLASDPAIMDALQKTRDDGQMRASPRIPLEREGRIEYGFAARLPVYNKVDSDEAEAEGEEEEAALDTVEKRQLQLRGFAAGIFRISEIVENALLNLSPSGIDMVIFDVSGEDERHFLYQHSSRKRSADTGLRDPGDGDSREYRELIQTISVTDRQWEVLCTSIPGHFQPDPWSGWVTLAGGLPFTALLTMYLSTLVGRTAKVKRLVTKRTAQLVELNEALNSEIKERLNAEKELQGLNETLEQRVAVRTAEAERHVEELEQFAYVTSHDLKAPLRGIANLATWLEEDLSGKLTEATREQLGLLRDRVQRMNALIEGLLEYSRIGQAAHILASVDTGELLTEVIDSLSPPEGYIVDVPANMPTLYTDRLHLYQVFSNLIGNSIKHSKGGQGHVWIKVRNRGEYYEFTIADDGPGIAQEYHDKVFMMFQTLAAKDYGSNTGIGLALVKKIVQEHGGSITLESEEGHGATFRFSWPRHE